MKKYQEFSFKGVLSLWTLVRLEFCTKGVYPITILLGLFITCIVLHVHINVIKDYYYYYYYYYYY